MRICLSIIILFFQSAAFCQTNNTTIKVLSFNILHGATMKGDFDLDRIAKVIIDADPDLVAMQEVDNKTNRAKGYDLVTELGLRTKMNPLFARAMYYDEGEYGEGILSKWSFINTKNVALPHSGDSEPRAALEVTIATENKDTISFIGTHLDHVKDATNRIAQAKAINTHFIRNKYPTILTGDLNDTPGSLAMNILEEEWTASYDKTNPQPTFPSDSPNIKIDYVMFSNPNQWKIVETKVLCDVIASDHCAYLVTLQLVE